MKILSKKKVISEAQSRLVSAVERSADGPWDPATLGYQGGASEAQVYRLTALNLWAGFGQAGNRYWNAFGLGDPNDTSIVVEVNPPRQGINRRCSGAFAEDDDGEVYLVHRGRVGGGREGIGKSAFLNWWSGPLRDVEDDDRTNQVVVVGRLGDEHFAARLASFVHLVHTFKAWATGSEEGGDEQVIDETETLKNSGHTFRPERTEKRTKTKISTEIEAESTHGMVVVALHKALKTLGIAAYNDKHRDLYVLDDDRKARLLLEVKSAASTTCIYEAVGQLAYHGEGWADHRAVVFPTPVSAPHVKRLEELNVKLLKFAWKGQRIVFPGLRDLLRSCGLEPKTSER